LHAASQFVSLLLGSLRGAESFMRAPFVFRRDSKVRDQIDELDVKTAASWLMQMTVSKLAIS
jgi:hypothetical protein